MDRKFIFVHTPKTGGLSLKSSIISLFGEENVFLEYGDNPLKVGKLVRNSKVTLSSLTSKKIDKKIIYGHFLPCKYCDLRINGFNKRKDHVYLTFLRDPLQRAISSYYFKKRVPLTKNEPPVIAKIQNENWSIETYLTSNEFRHNVYSKFFYGFPVENFDFIGTTENYSLSIKTLKSMYDEFNRIQIFEKNVNEDKKFNELYKVDAKLESKFRKLNQKDYEIYEKAKIINQNLINRHIQ